MIRTFFEFLLSRTLDQGRTPAAWLQRRIDRDESLADMQQLDLLLRSSAAEVRQDLAGNSATLTLPPERQFSNSLSSDNSSGHSAAWFTGLAVAAVLLLMFLPNWFRPSAPDVHAGELTQHLTDVPGEVLNLITRAAETSQTHLPQLSPLNNLAVPELPTWQEIVMSVESPLRKEVDSMRNNWQGFNLEPTTSPQEL